MFFKIFQSRPFMRAAFCLLFLPVLPAGCSAPRPLDLSYYEPPYQKVQTPQRFKLCHGYGCRTQSRVRLNQAEWAAVKAPLMKEAASARAERAQIAAAVALMERAAGEKTGTSRDAAGATIRGYGPYQMDCIDEAVNTSLYLQFFEKEGLLRRHAAAGPARRGAFIDGIWPHNTAVIRERESGVRYAVDSWYSANGERPYIVPLEEWLAGWRPEED